MILIPNKQDCTGCYACSSVCPVTAITMEADSEGFCYPVVDHNKCTRCAMCIAVCPIMETATRGRLVQSMPQAYAAYCLDEQLRLQSSSGGLFSLLAETIINSGGVVFGARFDDDFSVSHDYVENNEHLHKLRGSKYVQSRIGDMFKQVRGFLECDRSVMFTGTPCQISGLKRYLGREYDSLVCQDIICHGVPSPKVWQKYVTYRESCAASGTQKIAFRRKDEGWKRYSVSFRFENDMEYVQDLHNDLYMRAFLKNICLRPSCHACHFKSIYRESDITLADFWGIQHLVPTMDDDKGTSLVILHTQKGRELLKRLSGKVKIRPVSVTKAVQYNSAMTDSVKTHLDREAFFLGLDDERLDVLIKRYCTDKVHIRFKRKLAYGARCVLEKLGLLHKVQSMLLRR